MKRLRGPGKDQFREIDDEIVIGREGDLRLDDPEASTSPCGRPADSGGRRGRGPRVEKRHVRRRRAHPGQGHVTNERDPPDRPHRVRDRGRAARADARPPGAARSTDDGQAGDPTTGRHREASRAARCDPVPPAARGGRPGRSRIVAARQEPQAADRVRRRRPRGGDRCRRRRARRDAGVEHEDRVGAQASTAQLTSRP